MSREILAWLSDKFLWLVSWYFDRVAASWRHEVDRLGNRDDKWIWVGLCVFFTIFLLPYLTREALADSLTLGLSFVWSSFLAISFAYILRSPLLMIIVYVGVFFGREVTTLFTTAKEEATAGNIIGAAIVFCLGVYLITWANRMKRGAL